MIAAPVPWVAPDVRVTLPVVEELPWGDERPTSRADCEGRPRPCPWFGCRFHRFVDVNENGTMVLNIGRTKVKAPDQKHPRNLTRKLPVLPQVGQKWRTEEVEEALLKAFERAAEEDEPTCILDCVGDGVSYTLEETSDFFSVTRERIRQIELKALRKMHAAAGLAHDKGLADWEDARRDHGVAWP